MRWEEIELRNNAYWKDLDYLKVKFNITEKNELFDVFFTGVNSLGEYKIKQEITPL